MDHQIQNNGYIGASWVIRSQTVGLHEPGLKAPFRCLPEHGIEALHMTNLGFHPSLTGNFDQFSGLACVFGQRLFHKQVLHPAKGRKAQIVMRQGRRHDIYRIHTGHQILQVGIGGYPKNLHRLGQGLGIGIINTHQIKSLGQIQ